MSGAGMSTRQIAPVMGISQPQVVADKRAGDQELITSAEATYQVPSLPKSEKIMGSDGK
jgi:hypothetical protein